MNHDEQVMRDALTQHAADAPEAPGLAGAARARLARRRRTRVIGVAAASAVAVIAGVVIAGVGPATRTPETPAAASDSASPPNGADLPDGWRWESYGGIEVGVPGDWGWGNGDQRLYQWCVGGDRDPIVGRPGGSTLVGCPGEGSDPDPGTLLENTGPIVAFGFPLDRPDRPDRPVRVRGDRATRVVGGVLLIVQTEPELREQILDTVREVDVDATGCPVDDPVAADPGRRPEEPVDVASLTGVTAVTACKYGLAVPDGGAPTGSALLSSVGLQGPDAAAAVAEIAAAPVGGGPDSPESCMPEYAYGDDLIVLRISSDAGESQVHLRYSSCDHNGFDDGVHVRELTREAVAPFIAEANTLFSFSGRGKRGILTLGG